jgi:hypothetical protein
LIWINTRRYQVLELTIGTSSGGLSPRIALIRLKREWEGAFCIKTTSKDFSERDKS